MSPADAGRGIYQRSGKRALDVVAAAAVLIVTLPVQGVLAVLVRRKLGSPGRSCRNSTGLGERPFTMVKFRTMTDARDTEGHLLPDADRLPPFGQFLRSTSLDELPELWNVIKGDMSLVGPRPLLMKYLPFYTSRQQRRHEVRPGITGWAQVNGRNSAGWHDRLDMDVWYAENVSPALDLRILWMTVHSVLRRQGISAEGHATVPEFTGTHELPPTF